MRKSMEKNFRYSHCTHCEEVCAPHTAVRNARFSLLALWNNKYLQKNCKNKFAEAYTTLCTLPAIRMRKKKKNYDTPRINNTSAYHKFQQHVRKKKKKKERKDCHFEVTKISIMSCLYTASLLRPRERELPSFYLFLPPVVITWYLHVHTRAHLANKQIKQKNTLPDVYMYIMNTQNVHTATHTHTFAEFLRLLSFSTLTFPLASSTTVGKLWYKNETRTCTHACTQFFSLFLKTYVHARTRTEHLHFPLLSLFLPPLIFDLTHWHPSPWGREGNGSSPCESSTRRSAAQS